MSDARPNILLIMTDQQRFDTIGALGNPMIKTPTLDGLARSGTSFTHAYTPSPVCVAARASLLSGLPPHVTGCVDNMPLAGQAPPSLMDRLGDLGYQTHGVGKMHFAGGTPQDWGFHSRDVSEEEPGHVDAYAAFLRDAGYGHVTSPHGIRSEMYYVPQPSQLPARLHHNRWTVDRSLAFLERRDDAKPFFLMTSFIKPHPPFESPTPWNNLYRGPEMPKPFCPAWSDEVWTYWNHVQNRYKQNDPGPEHRLDRTRAAAYYGCISHIDYELGKLIDHVNEHAPNTVIIFTSDHGEMLGDYGCAGKRSMLDAAARVPLIVRWPDQRNPGQRVESAASLLDIFPTCLAAAGDEAPRAHDEGRDLAGLAEAPDDDRVVFSQFQRGRYALHLAATTRDKFIRSAPDALSWRSAPATAYQPERAVPIAGRVADADDPARRLEAALLERYAVDDRCGSVEDGHWVAYEPPTPLAELDPEDGLVFQDPPTLAEDLAGLPEGYRRPTPAGFEPERSLLAAPDPFVLKPAAEPTVHIKAVEPAAKAKSNRPRRPAFR